MDRRTLEGGTARLLEDGSARLLEGEAVVPVVTLAACPNPFLATVTRPAGLDPFAAARAICTRSI